MQHITYVIHIIKFFPPKKIFLHFFNATFQCGRYNLFKKKFKKVFDPGKVKKRASKIAHNWPRPFYSTVQTRPQPTAQNWFSVSWNRGTRHLFSYLWRWWYFSTFLIRKKPDNHQNIQATTRKNRLST